MRETNLCSRCLKCCQPVEEEVLLTPRDVFAIAYEKQLSVKHILTQYCEVETDGDFPIVKLRLINQLCPFLENNLCSLVRKPDVCASFPRGEEIWHNAEPIELKISCIPKFNQAESKGVHSRLYTKTHSFAEYLENCKKDPFYQKWMQAKTICSMLLLGMSAESDRIEVSQLIYDLLYENYDISNNFINQFEDNALKIIGEIG